MRLEVRKTTLFLVAVLLILQQSGIFQFQILPNFSPSKAQAQLGGDGECIKQILSAVGITSAVDTGTAAKNPQAKIEAKALAEAESSAQTAATAGVPTGSRDILIMLGYIAGQNAVHTLQNQAQSERHQGEMSCSQVLRDLIVKRIVDYMTDQIINWIQGGGKPSFVTDWGQFARQAGDIAFDSANAYLGAVGAGNLCGPFLPQLQLQAYVMNPNQAYLYGGILPLSCTFKDFQQNLSNQAHFLESGGWLAYDALFDPMNNPDWLSIRLEDYYNRTYISELEKKTNEALASSGFLGKKECADPDIQSQAEQACQGPYQQESDRQKCIQNYKQNPPQCKNWKILTPGDIVAKAAIQPIESKFQYAENVQSIISALVNVMIDKLVGFMKNGLANAGSQVDTATDQRYEQLTGQLNQKQIDTLSTNYQQLIDYFIPVESVYSQALQIAQTLSTSTCTVSTSTPSASDLQTIVNGMNAMLQEAQANLSALKSLDPNSSAFVTDITAAQNTLADFQKKYSDLFALLGINDISALNPGDNIALGEANTALQELQAAQSQCSGGASP